MAAQISTWQRPKLAFPPLRPNEIHIWRAALDYGADNSTYESLLTAAEIARSQRFVKASDRQKFIAARGILRLLLGRYLSQDSKSLEFCYGPQGKPELAAPYNTLDLQFNVSHSKDFACYAVGLQHPLGVDIEYHKKLNTLQAIVHRVFTTAEQQHIMRFPAEQDQAFYTMWTGKEALVKALGVSVLSSLADFTLSLQAVDKVSLAATACASGWYLQSFTIGPAYSAALACVSAITHIACYDFHS
jgi:4'-phosphopantetheinyl transferase